MATTRKKIVRKTKKAAARKSPVRRKKTTTPVKRKIVRRNTAKKPIKKNATKSVGLTWGKEIKAHPVTGKPCAGRPMSQRDQKLFTKMGKRRAGVTPSTISTVYGKKTASKKTITRKPAVRKPTTPKRRKGSPVTVTGLPIRPQKFVIVDGLMRYQSSSRLLTTARKKQAALEASNPRKRYRIVVLEKG